MHLVKSSGNKSLFISRPIFTPSIIINQVDSLLIDLNNTNASRSDKENVVVVDITLKNKETKESNRDAKVGLKV